MRDLITVDDYKIYAGITSLEQDEKLDLLVPMVSNFVKSYCARSFIDNYDIASSAFTDITQYFSGGSDIVYTEEFPIVTVQSVSYSEDYGQTYTTLTEYTDYVVDKQHDRVSIFNAETIESPNYFKIIYKGGYSETPPEVKLACYDLVEYYMRKESAPRKTQGSVSIEYVREGLPNHIKRVLDLYRNVR